MLYVADNHYFTDVFVQQEVHAGEDKEMRAALQTKLKNMQCRSLCPQLVFGDKFQSFPELMQHSFGDGFEGKQQYFNINLTHNPVNRHMDKAGFAGTDDFTGAGRSICTMRLDGPPCIIVLQELASRTPRRFPVTLLFHNDTFEMWGLTGTSHYLTDHGVYPTKVPSMGASDHQPHSINCQGKLGCIMSLTGRFGDVSLTEWHRWCALRGEV